MLPAPSRKDEKIVSERTSMVDLDFVSPSSPSFSEDTRPTLALNEYRVPGTRSDTVTTGLPLTAAYTV